MENKQPLLSICIPTRNRADVLKLCLKSIVEDPAFSSNEIEVLVSDNCSTDNTEEMILSYSEKYPNVKYIKNETDVGGDRNILLSLERGSGEFLKLNNDYSVFKEGALSFLLNEIKENLEEKPVLYFHKGDGPQVKEIITDFNEIFKKEKWSMSWIGCYGYWKDDFQNFEERDRRIDTKFQQVDWFIRSFKKKKKVVYLSKDLTTRLPFKANQGGYNFIEVHTRNYLIQFEELVSEGLLQESTIEYVKKNALLPSMVSWLIKLKIANKGRFSYDNQNEFKTLKREFGKYPWYRKVLIKSLIHSTLATVKEEYVKPFAKRILRKLHLYKKD